MDRGTQSYERFLAGDESGLAEIIRDYSDGLILYLNSFVNQIAAAELLAEDTFVRLAVRKPRNKGKAGFRTWLYAFSASLQKTQPRSLLLPAALLQTEQIPAQLTAKLIPENHIQPVSCLEFF